MPRLRGRKLVAKEGDAVLHQCAVGGETIKGGKDEDDEEIESMCEENEEAFVQEQLQAGRMQFLLDLSHP